MHASCDQAVDWLLLSSLGPLCPDSNISHGALVCQPAAEGRQSCDLVCHHGYKNALPVSSFVCEMNSLQWDGENKPLGGACQSMKATFNHTAQSELLKYL